VRLKVALSEWAVKTAEKLCASEGRLRDEAAAMLAIKAIGNQLYHWDRDKPKPEINPNHAVNVELQRTPPDKLKYYRPRRRWERKRAEWRGQRR
jgi:hypothetical protein